MRELKVIGLDAAGENVIMQDQVTDERFCVPADDRLRAASRGDLSRLGQIEIETNSQLRPREIQAKIRSGSSLEDVAKLAGLPVSRVERFAHPVLLERSNAAHLGSKAHPVRPDGPAVLTLGEIVASAFGARGLDPEAGEWDAWRPDGGEWIIQLTWLAGRSENSAHWRLHRDAHGGTVVPLDDAATELIDPNFTRALRPIAQLVPGISPVDQVLVTSTTDTPSEDPADKTGAPQATVHGPAAQHSPDQPSPADHQGAAPAATDGRVRKDTVQDDTRQDDAVQDDAAQPGGPASAKASPLGNNEPLPEEEDALLPPPDPAARNKKSRKNKPSMPSWEDVLLGVRSNTNS